MHRPPPTAIAPVDVARSLRFEQQVLPHLEAAWGLARWLAGNTHDAEDVLQEAMLRAYRYYDAGCNDNARAWLLTIVRNTFYTLLTQVKSASLLDEFDEAIHGFDDAVCTPESQLLRDADAAQLRHAIDQLPLEFREVLVLRELDGYSYKEIAQITGLKMGTVMSRLARARARLAHDLSTDGKEGQLDGGPLHGMQ